MNDKDHYSEILKQLIERDNISFKLLTFVPTVSGLIAFLTLWKDTHALPMLLFWVIGGFGALLSFFIWRWEVRNIQLCSILRDAAGELEEQYKKAGQLRTQPFFNIGLKKPKFLGLEIGKTEAERGIYALTILLWLALPFMAIEIKQYTATNPEKPAVMEQRSQ